MWCGVARWDGMIVVGGVVGREGGFPDEEKVLVVWRVFIDGTSSVLMLFLGWKPRVWFGIVGDPAFVHVVFISGVVASWGSGGSNSCFVWWDLFFWFKLVHHALRLN